MITTRAVCKINRQGEAEIVYCDQDGGKNPLVYYAHIGQHSSGGYDYFRTLRPAKMPEEVAKCDALIQEYRHICAIGGEELRIMKRLAR